MAPPRSARAISWVRPVVVAVLLLAAGVTVDVLLIRTGPGQELDASTFAAVGAARDALGDAPERLRILLPVASAALLGVAVIVALARRRWRSAIAPVVLPVVALALSTVLKDLLPRPDLGDHGYSENTFPSGHSAVTVACLIGFLWLLPRARVAVAIPLALLATAAAGFQVISYAHRLSDVIGGALLAGAIAACFLQRVGGLGAAGRAILWPIVALSGGAGAWALTTWMATGDQQTGLVGILLASGSAATAAIAVGAERAPGGAGSRSADAAEAPDQGVGHG
jgi:membrane-associated phospholipid phosphatase